jgi:hypothetical protein
MGNPNHGKGQIFRKYRIARETQYCHLTSSFINSMPKVPKVGMPGIFFLPFGFTG